MNSKNLCSAFFCRLGIIAYEEALRLQNRLVQARLAEKIKDLLLLLQHPSVITIGKSGKMENILAPQEILQEKGIKVIYTDRGGDVTFHGPGQLIIYPIFNIRSYSLSVPDYVWKLEEVIIRLLAHFGIYAQRIEKLRGVWVKGEKIASLGVHLSRWISKHGIAFNVYPDLTYFNLINPCGTGRPVTSLVKILRQDISLKEVEDLSIQYFEEVFNLKLEEQPLSALEPYLETNLATPSTT